jgi:hypothetical protein
MNSLYYLADFEQLTFFEQETFVFLKKNSKKDVKSQGRFDGISSPLRLSNQRSETMLTTTD